MSHLVAFGSLFGLPFLSHRCRIEIRHTASNYDKIVEIATQARVAEVC